MASTLSSDQRRKDTSKDTASDGDALWTRSAPKSLARGGMPIQPGKTWDAWTTHLDKRKKPTALSELLPGKTWPLQWALSDELLAHLRLTLAGRLPAAGKQRRQAVPLVADELHDWLRLAAEREPTASLGLDMLCLAHALPCLTGLVAPEPWWDLVSHLVNTAKDASALSPPFDPLAGQFLAGELPLTLAYLFPEVRSCAELLPIARENLSAGLVELLDGEGLPRGTQLDLLRPLLACWTRCRAMAVDLKQEPFTDEAQTQYEWLVLNALRLTGHDGRQLLTPGNRGEWLPELFTAALRLGGDSKDLLAASLTLKGQAPARRARTKRSRAARRITPKQLPAPSSNSEWSGVALLRADWLRNSPRLLVKYDGPDVQIELAKGGDVLLSGSWKFELEVDGDRLEPIDAWEDVCWNSDDEGEYLELEIGYPGGVRVQRQIVLSRRDHVFYLADVVLGAEQAELNYCGTLPLAAGMRFDIARETREGYIVAGRKKIAAVLPLALPEWRVDPRHGTLAAADGGIELRQRRAGINMYSPLFIDLDRRRFSKQLTWRQLTVAERLEIMTPDVAVGYRAQTGADQWMFYRALTARGNRSLLAQNLSSEFLAARFKPDGSIEEIVEIE